MGPDRQLAMVLHFELFEFANPMALRAPAVSSPVVVTRRKGRYLLGSYGELWCGEASVEDWGGREPCSYFFWDFSRI